MPQPTQLITVRIVPLHRTTGESPVALEGMSEMSVKPWTHWLWVGAAAVPVWSSNAQAQGVDLDALQETVRAQQQEIERQRERLRALERQEDENWLNERRAEEVKALIQDVLDDAQTRGSFAGAPVTAGYKGGFFIQSADNAFFLRINPEFQTRYNFNSRSDDADVDEEVEGFVLRRARLDFRGHGLTPALTYRVRLVSNRGNGNVQIDHAYIGYDFTDHLNLRVGQFKPAFTFEESVNAFRQLAVERSFLHDYFTIDFTQGAQLALSGDRVRGWVSVHDGSFAANTDFNADRTDIAVAGRVEALAAGGWRQFRDFSAWSNQELGVLLGLAADHEIGETGAGTSTPDITKVTGDVNVKYKGVSAFGAVVWQHLADNGDSSLPSNLDDANQLGLQGQVGVFLIPDTFEVFSRFEYIDFDGVYHRNSGAGTQGGTGNIAADELKIVTVGGNWYFSKHNAKLTVDLLWALDPIPANNTGSGLLRSSEDDQLAVRAQWQVAF